MPPLRSHYCGTRPDVPPDYQRRGTPYECLRTGVGVGKAIAGGAIDRPEDDAPPRQPLWPTLLLILLFVGVLMWHRSLPPQGEGQV